MTGCFLRDESRMLEFVVRFRFVAFEGRRCVMRRSTSVTVDVLGIWMVSVRGRPRPGNVVRRTLMVRESMLQCVCMV